MKLHQLIVLRIMVARQARCCSAPARAHVSGRYGVTSPLGVERSIHALWLKCAFGSTASPCVDRRLSQNALVDLLRPSEPARVLKLSHLRWRCEAGLAASDRLRDVLELAPKRIAMQRAEGWALRMCGPVAVLAKVSHPALWILGRATDVVVRLAGADPSRQRDEISTEEIRSTIGTQPDITAGQREIIDGAFAVQRRVVWNVLVPRVKVMRSPLIVPESLTVLNALQRMRTERTHMAVVVDEYGGFVGIVTMEDVFEEIVGDIYDEFDLDQCSSMREADGALVVPGDFPAYELEHLQVFVNGVDCATVAGIVLGAAGPRSRGRRHRRGAGMEVRSPGC